MECAGCYDMTLAGGAACLPPCGVTPGSRTRQSGTVRQRCTPRPGQRCPDRYSPVAKQRARLMYPAPERLGHTPHLHGNQLDGGSLLSVFVQVFQYPMDRPLRYFQ